MVYDTSDTIIYIMGYNNIHKEERERITAEEQRLTGNVRDEFPRYFYPKCKHPPIASLESADSRIASSCHAHLILNELWGKNGGDTKKCHLLRRVTEITQLTLDSRVTIRAMDHALEIFCRDTRLRLKYLALPRETQNDMLLFLAFLIKNKLISTIAEENGCE